VTITVELQIIWRSDLHRRALSQLRVLRWSNRIEQVIEIYAINSHRVRRLM